MILKYWMLLIASLLLLSSCAQNEADKSGKNEKDYNSTLYKILEAHGGIENWNRQHTLSFELGNQIHTIDLKSREVKINTPSFSMGNDNGVVWLKQDSAYFEGSPRFYHSLMFYFHTMPFVFADDGINYEEVQDKELQGKRYSGIKMTFDENVGDAPKDEYILYYDPESNKMEWLVYVSTFFSQEKSDSFNLIHYKKWEEANGFLLPTELQWHEYSNNEVGSASGDPSIFSNTKVSEEKMPDTFFDMPEDAMVDSVRTN